MSDLHSEVWEPGRLVRVKRDNADLLFTWQVSLASAIGGTLAVVVGILSSHPEAEEIGSLLMAVGLIFGIRSGLGLRKHPPRTITFDWGTSTVAVQSGQATESLPLSAVKAIELRRTHVIRKGRHQGRNRQDSQRIDIAAVVERDGPSSVEVLYEAEGAGGSAVDDFLTTRQRAQKLASALGVPYRLVGDHVNE